MSHQQEGVRIIDRIAEKEQKFDNGSEAIVGELNYCSSVFTRTNQSRRHYVYSPTAIGIFLLQVNNSFLKDFFSRAHRVFPQSTMLHVYNATS